MELANVHPSLYIIIACFILILLKNKECVFNWVSFIYPFSIALYTYNIGTSEYIIFKYFKVTYSLYDNLLNSGLSMVVLAINVYGFNKDKIQIIAGNFYYAAALICLYAGDYLSLFCGIEFMMLSSSFLIFKGKSYESSNAALKYFITHFISGSLILIGVIYLYIVKQNLYISNISSLLSDNDWLLYICYCCLFLGLSINVAGPFYWWMTNYYPLSSKVSFLYLMSFTTKISLILLFKLFQGCELLLYFGTTTIVIACVYIVLSQDRGKKLLSYLGLGQIGFIMMSIANNSPESTDLIYNYILTYLLYSTLISIIILHYRNTSNNLILIGFTAYLLGLMPFNFTKYSKNILADLLPYSYHYLILINGAMSVAILPPLQVLNNWRQWFRVNCLFMIVMIFGLYSLEILTLINALICFIISSVFALHFQAREIITSEPNKIKIALLILTIALIFYNYGAFKNLNDLGNKLPVNKLEFISSLALIYLYTFFLKAKVIDYLNNFRKIVKNVTLFHLDQKQSPKFTPKIIYQISTINTTISSCLSSTIIILFASLIFILLISLHEIIFFQDLANYYYNIYH